MLSVPISNIVMMIISMTMKVMLMIMMLMMIFIAVKFHVFRPDRP